MRTVKLLSLKQLQKVLSADPPHRVEVVFVEQLLEVDFVHERVGVDEGAQELRVLDFTGPIDVRLLHNGHRQGLTFGAELQPRIDVVQVRGPFPVLVETLEYVPQVLHLVRVYNVC